MANEFYTDNISNTVNSTIDDQSLDVEIRADSSIAPVGDYLGHEQPDGGGVFKLWFINALDASAQTALASRIALHTGFAANFPVVHKISDTVNNKIHFDDLTTQVEEDSDIIADAANFLGFVASQAAAPNDDLIFYWSADLGATARTALTAIVAAHTGIGPPVLSRRAIIALQSGEQTITGDATWDSVGGYVDYADKYVVDLSKLVWCLRFSYKTTEGAGGEKAQVRMCESLFDDTGSVELLVPNALSDTGGVWKTIDVTTTLTPRKGLNQYNFEARLNSSASLLLRYVTFHVCKVVG